MDAAKRAEVAVVLTGTCVPGTGGNAARFESAASPSTASAKVAARRSLSRRSSSCAARVLVETGSREPLEPAPDRLGKRQGRFPFAGPDPGSDAMVVSALALRLLEGGWREGL